VLPYVGPQLTDGRHFNRRMRRILQSLVFHSCLLRIPIYLQVTLRCRILADRRPKRQEPPASRKAEILRNYKAHGVKGTGLRYSPNTLLTCFIKCSAKEKFIFKKWSGFEMPRGMLIQFDISCRRFPDLYKIFSVFVVCGKYD
jgi:hypothetical protein